jgi:hypothetical protein
LKTSGLIHRLFPRARFLHCNRDPMDIAWSCFRQDFQGGLPWAFDLQDIATVCAGQQRLMRHWRGLLPQHILEVGYEYLVSELEPGLRRVCEFLGLDFDPRMLDPAGAARVVGTASREQVRGPVSTASIGSWKPYREQLAPALARLRALDVSVDDQSV